MIIKQVNFYISFDKQGKKKKGSANRAKIIRRYFHCTKRIAVIAQKCRFGKEISFPYASYIGIVIYKVVWCFKRCKIILC